MIIRKLKQNNHSGFVILFAVTVAAIMLSLALGVTNIALEEIKFGTSAKDTNNAFFAADTGNECALYNDYLPTGSPFSELGSSGEVSCVGETIDLNDHAGPPPWWDFVITGLGTTGTSCAKVRVTKETITDYDEDGNPTEHILTTIVSKGFSIGDSSCDSTNQDRVERELVTTY